jgi:hypothetical protein
VYCSAETDVRETLCGKWTVHITLMQWMIRSHSSLYLELTKATMWTEILMLIRFLALHSSKNVNSTGVPFFLCFQFTFNKDCVGMQE